MYVLVKKCKNIEHKKPCKLNEDCKYCGKSTCSPNFAYHICIVESIKIEIDKMTKDKK